MRGYMVCLAAAGFLGGCTVFSGHKARSVEDFSSMYKNYITSLQQAMDLFPRTVAEITAKKDAALIAAKSAQEKILALAPQERTFENTMAALDYVSGVLLGEPMGILQIIGMVYQDNAMQEAAKAAEIEMKQINETLLASNRAVYLAVQDYVAHAYQTEKLTSEQRYFVEETLLDYKRRGLHLPDEQLAAVVALKNEIEELVQTFDTNLAHDNRTITVSAEGLAGVRQGCIDTLEKDVQGQYVLKCDYPTSAEVSGHCSVEDTRRRYAEAFGNRGMPNNMAVLDQIIAKRDAYAKALGFESFAAFELSGEMVQEVARAEGFLEQVVAKAAKKCATEIALLKTDLPAGVEPDVKGRLKSWDVGYAELQYQKKHFNIDQRAIAEYFPLEKTLDGLFGIYQQFLGLRFAMVQPAWSWHADVQIIEVFDAKTDELRGYIALDLHPRPGKYTHACCAGIKYPVLNTAAQEFGGRTPAFAAVIANFPKPTPTAPALLKHSDVDTFFHEFGHAMHFLLSATALHTQAGYNTKMDFVEMPSQMFEEWLFDKELLKSVSCHYQTGLPLPDELIDGLIKLKQFSSGESTLAQARYAFMSLAYFGPGAQKDTEAIRQELNARLLPHIIPNHAVRPQASFGHLGHYGARYYGYLWSKVFALDLFEHIRPQGLLNTQSGARFIEAILGRGGSCNPNELLQNFLGREPQVDAFFKDQGFE